MVTLVHRHAERIRLEVCLRTFGTDTCQRSERRPHMRIVLSLLGVEQNVEDAFWGAIHTTMMTNGVIELFRAEVDPIPDSST